MKQSNVLVGLELVAVALSAAGCSAPMEDGEARAGEESVAEEQSSFVNNVSFVNCTTAQQTKIRAASDTLFARINEPSNTGASMRACLNDSFLSMATNGAWGGDIQSQFKRVAVTQIACKDSSVVPCGGVFNWSGCAGVGVSGESLSLDNSFVNNSSATTIAGAMTHELAHNYGYDHPDGTGEGEFSSSIPERARTCVQNSNSAPFNQSRTFGMPGEAELGYIGRFGGTPFELTGTGSQFVSGIDSFANATINALSVRFKDAFGTTSFTNRVGSASGVSNLRRCDRNPDDVVIGVQGTAGSILNQLIVRCAPRSNLSASYDLAADGNANGFPFVSMCPAGKAVRAVRGRAGSSIDQLRLVCDDVTKTFSPEHAPHKVGPFLGSASGKLFSLRCSGNGAIQSLTGRADSLVKRLGGLCRATGGTLPVIPGNPTHPASNWLGGNTGTAFTNGCNPDELMIGVQVRSGSSINALAPICAKAPDWDQSATTARDVATFSGGSGGTLTRLACPSFQFLVGLEAWGTDRVMGLQAVCADMR